MFVIFSNKYEIKDDVILIYLSNKKGVNKTVTIDINDLNKLKELNIPWHLFFSNTIKDYYATATYYLGYIDGKPKYKTIYMHRFLKDCPDDMTVDHLNHNTLDNRQNNLEVKTDLENNRNRKNKANNNSSTGVRNVTYIKSISKYVVQFWKNNKNHRMGEFDTLEEAKVFADKHRKNYYTNT